MPRRKFPQIRRHGPVELSRYEARYQSEAIYARGQKTFTDALISKWRGQMKKPTGLSEPVRNGENHALSITCVLDLILRTHHDSYIYAAGMTDALTRDYGHLVIWDPYTVGRILSGLMDHQPTKPGFRPMDTANYSGMRMIAVMDDSRPAWEWLGRAREKMGNQALNDQKLAREGLEVLRTEATWIALVDVE